MPYNKKLLRVKFERLIEEGYNLNRTKSVYVDESHFNVWMAEINTLFDEIFPTVNQYINLFNQIKKVTTELEDPQKIHVKECIQILERIQREIEEGTISNLKNVSDLNSNQPYDKSELEQIHGEIIPISRKILPVLPLKENIFSNSKDSQVKSNVLIKNRSVFVVHGHDHKIRDPVALFVEKQGIRAVILSDEPIDGKTLIESLETYKDVKYAIVLLTPDDLGKEKDKDVLKTRARQNVIFELGLFIGWLKRENVCAINNEVDELPSDYLGIRYVQFDEKGAWKIQLAKALERAGFKIDIKNL